MTYTWIINMTTWNIQVDTSRRDRDSFLSPRPIYLSIFYDLMRRFKKTVIWTHFCGKRLQRDVTYSEFDLKRHLETDCLFWGYLLFRMTSCKTGVSVNRITAHYRRNMTSLFFRHLKLKFFCQKTSWDPSERKQVCFKGFWRGFKQGSNIKQH